MSSFEKLLSSFRNRSVGLELSDIRYLPRWIVLLIDLFLAAVAITLSYMILFMLEVAPASGLSMMQKYLLILGVNLVYIYIFRTFAGIVRHSTFIDLAKLLLASFSTAITLYVINSLVYMAFGRKLFLNPVLALYFVISFTMLFVFRLAVKQLFRFYLRFRRGERRRRVLVYGTDGRAVAVARSVMDNPDYGFSLVGFLSPNEISKRASLLGKPIVDIQKLNAGDSGSRRADAVIVLREDKASKEFENLVNLLLDLDLRIFTAPAIEEFGKPAGTAQIRELQIEDLLDRSTIKIENEKLAETHTRKSILITGGAGSIGSEILRQVACFDPAEIVVIDQAETPLHDIQLEMQAAFPHIRFRFILADISNYYRLTRIFETHRFSVVYHAAAYKHVPIIEENPHEGILVNVLGTKNLALLAGRHGVDRFVMVSTDKAVNPTNVMGASKRTAELFVQALQSEPGNKTRFITTRFGNVLGSNGSVIPHFRRQIKNGGPITVTHPDIVRYFMTIPEACELVLQAGTMGQGGEIFVFDMGEPVKILDLAHRMIKLSGLVVGVDIDIVYTGLRPGEKLYEELLSNDACTLPTPHEKIMISKDPCMQFADIDHLSHRIIRAAIRRNKVEVVRLLKTIVPEYKSQNSEFEQLDKV